jgi:hypothetical protein
MGQSQGRPQGQYQSSQRQQRYDGPLFGGHNPGDFSLSVRFYTLHLHYETDSLETAPDEHQQATSYRPKITKRPLWRCATVSFPRVLPSYPY